MKTKGLEIILGIILILIGSLAIVLSTQINEDLSFNIYELEGKINLENGSKSKGFENFLWKRNFSQKKSIISFKKSFNENIDYIRFDLPTFVNNESIKIEEYKCKAIECTKIKTNLSWETTKNPVNNPSYTTLMLDNFQDESSNKKWVIQYKSNLNPHGVFELFGNSTRYESHEGYIIELNLGDKYRCKQDCLDNANTRGIKQFPYGDDNKIRLSINEKEEKVQPLRFKIYAENRNNLFWKEILRGLGISLLAAGIVLSLEGLIGKKKYSA